MDVARVRSSIFSYGLAALAVAASTALTRLLWEVGDSAIFPMFFAAVVVAAWYGGLGPGLFATAASGLTTAFLLMPPVHSFKVARDDVLRLLVFTLVSLLTSSLHAATRRARDHERVAKEAAEQASAAKARFLAMVSHELRNPLNPIALTAAALEHDPSLPVEVKQDMALIRHNVDLEVRLIEDLLDLSRLGSGKLRLRLEPLDLRQPLREAVHVCQQDLRDKRIELCQQLPDEPMPVVGDAARLEQIFWNLLRNAIKFTPEHGRIELRAHRDADTIAVEVRDTGIGIEPQRLAVLFRAFEQGGPDITARFGGLGLGLAICRALTEAHGGTITAESPGKGLGATFRVVLPGVAAKSSHAAPLPASLASV